MIVAIAGGVGGAKLADGLQTILPAGDLMVVVNTADDFELHGLRICPDLDTVLYNLAGIANPEFGWGIAGDTRATQSAMTRLGADPWFILGDQDLGTHILRTERIGAGETLTQVMGDFARSLGLTAQLVPMTDDPVATIIETEAGDLAFQDYFVRRRHSDDVTGVHFHGIEWAEPNPLALEALPGAEMVIFCPSNPIVSLGPVLSVPGMQDAISASPGPRIAVSPIVGGKALKGPADQMMRNLGIEPSALGIAAFYGDLIDGLVIDHADAGEAAAIEAAGTRVLVTDAVMRDREDRARLATEVVAFGRELAGTSAR